MRGTASERGQGRGKAGQVSTADEVRAARAALGMTWKQLAEAVGVSWRAVAYWEAGTRRPGKPALNLLRKLLSEVHAS
jgi:DNA-binding transcriptional regulator YiaG